MMQELSLHLEVLPLPQRRLWEELSQVPKEFVLYGGTALALRLGHIATAARGVDLDHLPSLDQMLASMEQNRDTGLGL